jgi:K+-sensing histidine kinase KdpD
MSSSNPLLWPRPPVIWSYGIAVLAVAAALTISRWPALHLQDAPVSLFLCAVIVSAWFGGAGPGLLATALSAFAFYYCFLPPIYSLAAKPGEIPRLLVFTVSALFVGSLSAAQRSAMESLRRARDDLKETVQEVQRTNEALQAESRERKRAEEASRQAQADLARVSRVTTMGELTASLGHEVNQPIAAAVTNAKTCLR